MNINLTTAESEKFFYNALCNSLDYFRGYGFQLDYETEDYKQAKANWLDKNPGETACREDVYLQILKDGKTLTFVDVENVGEYTRVVALADVHDRVCKAPSQNLIAMNNEEDDAGDGDIILQTVLFEEVIFG